MGCRVPATGLPGNPYMYLFELVSHFRLIAIQKWIQYSSVTQSCLTLCHPMNHSMPGLSVHHQLLESTQTRVHWIGDAIQPSHSLSSPSPPALNLSQHQGLFQWVTSLHQVAKVLEFHLQHQSFQWTVFKNRPNLTYATIKVLPAVPITISVISLSSNPEIWGLFFEQIILLIALPSPSR